MMHPELVGSLADAYRSELTSRAVPLQAGERPVTVTERRTQRVPGGRWSR